MRLYHGTGALDDVLRSGFDPAFFGSSFDGEDGFHEAHGGFYLTEDAASAATFATRSGTSHGVLIVEVPEEHLVVDEDALTFVAQHRLGRHQSLFEELCGMDEDEAEEHLEDGRLERMAVAFANLIEMPMTGANVELCGEYLVALAMAIQDESAESDFQEIVKHVGQAAPATVTSEWAVRIGRTHSCRVIDCSPEVVGWVGVEIEPDGSRVTRMFHGGDVSPDEVNEIVESIVGEFSFDNPGIEVDLPEIVQDETLPEGSPYASTPHRTLTGPWWSRLHERQRLRAFVAPMTSLVV